ncbi:MAG: 4Fe-4S dicluster domain-containing protein [Syntrophobacteraceae bacterium]|nr:4Fe-4S dicluster domain-containing protein [Syntrophobacteraceae bacterium]
MNQDKKMDKRGNALLSDGSRCIGCFACETACKLEHDLAPDTHPIRAIVTGPLERDGSLVLSFLPLTCAHCETPACVAACLTGAMQKREDGIVFSDPELCIGCQTCAVACPFGVPQLNSKNGKIAKCDGCKDRVDRGLWPVCALRCPTGALLFGSPVRVVQEKRQKEATRVANRLLGVDTST